MTKEAATATDAATAQAPGRINIIGEHTDYNDGFVLPAAIGHKMTVQARRNGTPSTVHLTARATQQSFSFDLRDFSPVEKGWPNYVMGVVSELQKLGGVISGFDAEFESDVPIGSGMSSSAALECSFALALNELFGLGFDQWQLIKASQRAEHNFVGNKCGIMDQFAGVMGKKDHVMLLDCRSLDFQYFPLELGAYQLLLLNTNVSHSLASSEYNTRRAECEQGVHILQQEYPGIANLRDVNLKQIAAMEEQLPEHVFRRCRHVVSENQRVLDATKALLAGDFNAVGELMYQSHFSLQNDYEVSCPELDFLVQQTLDKDYVLGSRMMGGGFGGCTISIVEKERVAELVEEVSSVYSRHFGIDLTPVEVVIGDGAKVIRQ
ncbi:MAG TPA: galactokinase [Saprospiraceae bacterium]|nr:galactokinase [Saprospiraceae bacterium]HRJ17041.1 galactokinase [Saprospiraceae bacterium]HRK81448.1 galactokinase [Saprospiraceae bacterium]